MSAFTLDNLKADSAGPTLQVVPVPVYEWEAGKVMYIGELTAEERLQRVESPWADYRKREKPNEAMFAAFAVAACWCNTQQRDFVAKDAQATEEIAALLQSRSGKVVMRLFEAADKLNGFSSTAAEEAEKN